ncbi:MAG: MFS transporter [Opitutaceae bacterium]|nr:MFS transporter [Opitutaceae bacterium]
MSDRPARPKPENLLLNLVCNVGVPTVILTWFSGARGLGPKAGLLVALAFPLGYGVYDFLVRRRTNFISVLGFTSVLISGGFGLMQLDGFWFAVKDAAIPSAIGLAVLASLRAKTPLVTELLYNPQVIDVDRVDAALTAHGTRHRFSQLLREASYLIALAFFVSAVLNYGLARHLLKSPPATEAFNNELAKMHLLSWPVIVLPSMGMMMFALWRLLNGLEGASGLTMDEILRQPPKKEAAAAKSGAAEETDRRQD